MRLPDERGEPRDHKRNENGDRRLHRGLGIIAEAAEMQMRDMQVVLLARVFDLKVEKKPLLAKNRALFVQKSVGLFAAGARECH